MSNTEGPVLVINHFVKSSTSKFAEFRSFYVNFFHSSAVYFDANSLDIDEIFKKYGKTIAH